MPLIYVGNLSPTCSQAELKNLFIPFGKIRSANIINDSFNNLGMAHAFVVMDNLEHANKAVVALKNTAVCGEEIIINIALDGGSF